MQWIPCHTYVLWHFLAGIHSCHNEEPRKYRNTLSLAIPVPINFKVQTFISIVWQFKVTIMPTVVTYDTVSEDLNLAMHKRHSKCQSMKPHLCLYWCWIRQEYCLVKSIKLKQQTNEKQGLGSSCTDNDLTWTMEI